MVVTVAGKLARIGAAFVSGEAPGRTEPKYLMLLLKRKTASLKSFHPEAQIWVSPQGFLQEWKVHPLTIGNAPQEPTEFRNPKDVTLGRCLPMHWRRE